jgi:hypothetical protein
MDGLFAQSQWDQRRDGMNLPQIELDSIPGLDVATGVFGSISDASATYNDSVVVIMVYIYDTIPPDSLL